jgi:hypothetical protein
MAIPSLYEITLSNKELFGLQNVMAFGHMAFRGLGYPSRYQHFVDTLFEHKSLIIRTLLYLKEFNPERLNLDEFDAILHKYSYAETIDKGFKIFHEADYPKFYIQFVRSVQMLIHISSAVVLESARVQTGGEKKQMSEILADYSHALSYLSDFTKHLDQVIKFDDLQRERGNL